MGFLFLPFLDGACSWIMGLWVSDRGNWEEDRPRAREVQKNRWEEMEVL